ncbi:MAG TPA: chemotaxis protein CheA [Succinivibrionaceae bacterium]|nr:chemotaxis protein CheA [Succinivibrionaceae bacterium]
MDEEILQDFIVEAGEIIEKLDEQLVQIEKTPDDKDLLNAIFRGFHTIKGGAGFLQLNPLVEVCHAAESLFDELRNGRVSMSSDLMDAVLAAYDEISAMFENVKNGETLPEPPADLIERLHALASGQVAPKAQKTPEVKEEVKPEPQKEEQKAEANVSEKGQADASGSIDDITEEEFEALLDQLHGKGNAPGSEHDKQLEKDATDQDFDELLKQADAGISEVKPRLEQAKTQEEDHGSESSFAPKSAEPVAKVDAAKTQKTETHTKPEAETTVRVDTKVLDDIMNMVGELVLVRNRLVNMAQHRSNDHDLSKTISNLDVITGDLQSAVMKTRMQPVKKVFGRFPRVVRDLAHKLGKKIELRMEGEDTELDKNLVDALADPMVHMVRNCCDHGIELPRDRVKAGKNETGTVLLAAAQQGDHILLRISDDGQGMDPVLLRQVAVKKGILDKAAAERLSDAEALDLVFAPGFSTNTVVTDISGRGVGMDVVKTNINKLNGSVRVLSELGKGTTIEIKVPLTLAILPTLMISIAKRTFALPLTSVSEIFYLSLDSMRNVDGLNTIVIRDKAIPLFFLRQWFDGAPVDDYLHHKAHIVLVQVSAAQLVGFVVDDLLGQEEVVIKPLDNILHRTPGLAGATVTSDGGIALILDIPGLIRAYAHKTADRY